ncbi:hypothetical protein SDC9_149216 [bioreactor metagenome]|uniref:Uncharacterized protein n=1 Tax=bioreactor metagenome TaxID=1076179 RepID=A0A645EN84_9ZZZZ
MFELLFYKLGYRKVQPGFDDARFYADRAAVDAAVSGVQDHGREIRYSGGVGRLLCCVGVCIRRAARGKQEQRAQQQSSPTGDAAHLHIKITSMQVYSAAKHENT